MLKQLYIRNFVLIDELQVQFDKGMSVITGETGAGKSILFGALSLLKGRRADLSELKHPAQKCVLEARIDVSKYKLRRQFEAEDLDYLEEAIFRREVNAQGKSRAFINDTPVRLEQMQVLGDLLFDIHSQHQSLSLNEPSYRLNILDELAGSKRQLEAYQSLYSTYRNLEKEQESLLEEAQQSRQEEDYLQFQFNELEELALKKDEEEALEQEHKLLANGDQMISALNQFLSLMDAEDRSMVADLKAAVQNMEEISRINSSLDELKTRFVSAQIEMSDIVNEVEHYRDQFDFDAERLQTIEDRMADIHRLKQKHGLRDGNELLAHMEDLETKLSRIGNFEDQIENNAARLDALKVELMQSAEALSANRRSFCDSFETSIINSLQKLGIPQADFEVVVESTELGPFGIDKIDYHFSANKGKAPQSVKQVASGGELSRIMLAIKRELAGKKQMPALLFDEIDTGVSGEVADQLGNILREMSQNHQILSITHLPQLAAKGNHHYFVYKETASNEPTKTSIKRLSQDERVEELAKMLSGEKVSDAAVDNARDLLAH